MGVHAIGDVTIEEMISAYEKAIKTIQGTVRGIFTVIRFILPREDHVIRLRDMSGYAEIQNGFIYFLGEAYYKNT